MILVIDAYNLIKRIAGVDFVEEGLRQRFIERLVRYAQAKSLEILLVFDGGDGFQYSRKYVTVFYSGPAESADDLIQELLHNFATKALQNQILLVTDDRELLNLAHASNIGSLSVTLFYNYLLKFEAESKIIKLTGARIKAYDYQIYDVPALESPAKLELDRLMLAEELDFSELALKETLAPNRARTSQGPTSSKQVRQLKKKIKKL